MGPEEVVFDNLPNEMKDNILGFLNLTDKRSARLVCRLFKDIIDHKTKFRAKLTDDTAKTYENIDCEKVIHRLTVEDCSRVINITTAKRSSYAKKNVKHLQFLGGTSERNIIGLLRLHPNVQILTMGSTSLVNVRNATLLRGLRLDMLTQLEIVYSHYFLEPFKQLLGNYFPALRSLQYNNGTSRKGMNYMCSSTKLLIPLFEFAARHSTTIKQLKIVAHKHSWCVLPEYFRSRSLRMLSMVKHQNLTEKLEFIQLDELALSMVASLPVGHGSTTFTQLKSLEQHLVYSQRQLKSAEVTFIGRIDEEEASVLRFIPNCQETLTSLKIQLGRKSAIPLQASSFDCALLQNCSKLESFYIHLHLNYIWSFRANESNLRNVHLLPTTITRFEVMGYLPIEKVQIIFKRLKNLDTFACNVCDTSLAQDVELLICVLIESRVRNFILKDPGLVRYTYVHTNAVPHHPIVDLGSILAHVGITVEKKNGLGLSAVVDRSRFRYRNRNSAVADVL